MKIIPTNTCRLISERISEIFRNSQNKKPTIIKNKFGFKLNLGIISFRIEPAPIVQLSPIEVPLNIIVPAPIQQLSPMYIGEVLYLHRLDLSSFL